MIGFTQDAKYSSRYPRIWHSETFGIRAANCRKYIGEKRKNWKLVSGSLSYTNKCIRTGTSDLRVGHLDNSDRQVAREEAEENHQYHLRDSPFATFLLHFPDVPPRCMRWFYRWCGVLSHPRFWSTITESDHQLLSYKGDDKKKKMDKIYIYISFEC